MAVGDQTFAVSDAEALAAMAFAFRHLKIVVEPGGAAALAAVLAGKLEVKGSGKHHGKGKRRKS